MFERFFGSKVENKEKRASDIVLELGVLLNLTIDDKTKISSGEKLDLDEHSKELYEEGRKLVDSGSLEIDTSNNLSDVLEAIEANYKV